LKKEKQDKCKSAWGPEKGVKKRGQQTKERTWKIAKIKKANEKKKNVSPKKQKQKHGGGRGGGQR